MHFFAIFPFCYNRDAWHLLGHPPPCARAHGPNPARHRDSRPTVSPRSGGIPMPPLASPCRRLHPHATACIPMPSPWVDDERRGDSPVGHGARSTRPHAEIASAEKRASQRRKVARFRLSSDFATALRMVYFSLNQYRRSFSSGPCNTIVTIILYDVLQYRVYLFHAREKRRLRINHVL